MDKLSSREVAIQNGYKYYYSGTPCKNGHKSARYTMSAICVECNREKSKRNIQRVKKIALNHGLGLKTPTTGVHPDDLETAEAFLKALLFDRGIY